MPYYWAALGSQLSLLPVLLVKQKGWRTVLDKLEAVKMARRKKTHRGHDIAPASHVFAGHAGAITEE